MGAVRMALAGALIAGLAAAPAAGAATPTVRILDTSQRSVLRAGVVHVKTAGPARVVIRRGSTVVAHGRADGTAALPLVNRAAIEDCRRDVPLRATGGARAPLTVDAGACNPNATAPLKAGAGSADITPPIGTPMFAYTARSGLANPNNLPNVVSQLVADPDHNLYAKTFVASRGIHTRVRARSLILQTPNGKFALVQADLGGIPYALTQEVLERIAATGIDGDHLLLSATHTHSSTGPIWPADSGGYALLGGDLFDPRIFDLTAAGIAESIVQADGRLEPARAGVGTTQVTDASANRSFDAFRNDPEAPKDEAAAKAAAIDPALTVLRVDSRDGQPIGVWSNFAIHPTSFGDDNLLFSGDNAGFAERIAEAGIAAGATVPPRADRPVVDVWTNANEGDIAPNATIPKVDGQPTQYAGSSYAGANVPGARVGGGILSAWRDAGGHMSGTLDLDARRSFLRFDGTGADGEPVGPIPALGAGGIVAPDGFCAPVDGTAGPGQGMKFPALAGAGLIPMTVPVSFWRIGRTGIAAFPAEITKTMGARIRTSLAGPAFDRVIIAGLTNAYVSYTATPEEYDSCRYEGSFTLFGRREGARWRDFAGALQQALVKGEPAPQGAPEPPDTAVGSTRSAAQSTAGAAVKQPAPTLRRRERATFSWKGGTPQRGRAFVELQRRDAGGWRTVATDDTYQDITERADDGTWTETYQFADCDPLGRYRFRVDALASSPFELQATTLKLQQDGSVLRAVYPDPGKETLLALPRLAASGIAVVDVAGRSRRLVADPQLYGWKLPGAVRVRSLVDGCGNHATQ